MLAAAAGGGALAAPVETVLYSFNGGSDGDRPYGGLIADKEGALYGTTVSGGNANVGTVFKLTPPVKSETAWKEDVLYRFTGGSDGAFPSAGLITDDRHGALYGTTEVGGISCPQSQIGCGTVFKLTGTGFVTGIPFATFGAKLAIDFGISPNPDAFELLSEFTLGQSSDGINPVTEPVTFQIGTFATTIPAGSFTGTGFGLFTFGGVVDGVELA